MIAQSQTLWMPSLCGEGQQLNVKTMRDQHYQNRPDADVFSNLYRAIEGHGKEMKTCFELRRILTCGEGFDQNDSIGIKKEDISSITFADMSLRLCESVVVVL